MVFKQEILMINTLCRYIPINVDAPSRSASHISLMRNVTACTCRCIIGWGWVDSARLARVGKTSGPLFIGGMTTNCWGSETVTAAGTIVLFHESKKWFNNFSWNYVDQTKGSWPWRAYVFTKYSNDIDFNDIFPEAVSAPDQVTGTSTRQNISKRTKAISDLM